MVFIKRNNNYIKEVFPKVYFIDTARNIKEFQDALAVSVNEKTKELTKEEKQVSFDVPDTDKIEVHIEYKKNDIKRIKNPIGRFFAYLFFFLLSPIIFFADNDNGIGIHKFFYDAKPFDVKNTTFIKYEKHESKKDKTKGK